MPLKEESIKARDLLKGKENWPTWSPGICIRLRAEGVYRVIEGERPTDPASIPEEKTNEFIESFLSAQEPLPQAGFSSEKLAANHQRWKASLAKEIGEWQKANDIAFAIIYERCQPHIQALISDKTDAKSAWNILQSSYSETGFASTYAQVAALKDLSYSGCKNLEEYINKLNSVRANLTARGKTVDPEVWSAFLLHGLDDSFQLLTRQIIQSDKAFSLEDIQTMAFAEERSAQARIVPHNQATSALEHGANLESLSQSCPLSVYSSLHNLSQGDDSHGL